MITTPVVGNGRSGTNVWPGTARLRWPRLHPCVDRIEFDDVD